MAEIVETSPEKKDPEGARPKSAAPPVTTGEYPGPEPAEGRGITPTTLLATFVALVAAAVATYLIVLEQGGAKWWMEDLFVYRAGGEAVRNGSSLYDIIVAPFNLPFTYPPLAAVLFAPLSLLDVDTMRIGWAFVTVLCLEVVLWRCLGAAGMARGVARYALMLGLTLAWIWVGPVYSTLGVGQINLLLLLLIVVDLTLPDRSRWKGVGVGIATGIKLTPAIFVVYLLLTRRLRAAAVAVGAFLATVAVGFVALPSASLAYWSGVAFDTSRAATIPQMPFNQSLRSTLLRFAHSADPGDVLLPWIAGCLVFGACGLALAVWAHRRGDDMMGMLACAVVGLVVSPVTYEHHWVWVVPLVIYLAAMAWQRRSAWGAVGVVALTAAFTLRPFSMWSPTDPKGALAMSASELFWASWYPMLAVLLLVAGAIHLWRKPSDTPTPVTSA